MAGVVFAYFVVVPAAIKFLLNFNDDQFNIQIRAREYYSFFSLSPGTNSHDRTGICATPSLIRYTVSSAG